MYKDKGRNQKNMKKKEGKNYVRRGQTKMK